MNYIEYMESGRVNPNLKIDTLQTYLIKDPRYYSTMTSYDFKQPSSRLETKNSNAENTPVITDGTKLNIHPKVSSNRSVSKFNIDTFASILNNTLNRIGHLITNNEQGT